METSPSENSAELPIVFREVHRSGYLRRVSMERRNGVKRGENVWVSFCVHDDREPFLETYVEQKLAHAHRPDWCAPMLTCLHVTPAICAAQEDSHEFVVTMATGTVKLAAPSWDTMMDWVNTLRSKLVEMKILTPPENFYSQMPQIPRPLLPTRDPNSPLPPTPAGPLAVVPGTDPAESNVTVATAELVPISPPTTPQITPIANRPPVPIPIQPLTVQLPSSPVQNSFLSEPPVIQPIPRIQRSLSLQNSRIQNSEENSRVQNLVTQNSEQNSTVQNSGIQIYEQNPRVQNSVIQNSEQISRVQNSGIQNPDQILRLQNLVSQSPLQNSRVQNFSQNPTVSNSSVQSLGVQNPSPVSTIQVTSICNPIPRIPPIARVQNVLVQQPPIVQLNSMIQPAILNPSLPSSIIQLNSVVQPETSVLFSSPGQSSTTSLYISPAEPSLYRSPLNRSTSEPAQNVTVIEVDGPMDAVYDLNDLSSSLDSSHAYYEHLYPGETGETTEPSIVHNNIQNTEPSLEVTTSLEHTTQGTDPSVEHSTQGTEPSLEASLSASTQTEEAPYIPSRFAVRRGRVVPIPSRMPPPFRPPALTLREQQVRQLTREMRHPGGVRLQIRRRDCSGSIALVDAFGAVWIAGWKQREHPTLYNALHIGDRVLTVAGLAVPNAAHAHRIIRTTSCVLIEFIVRRVPFGRVLAIRRDVEGQDLGLELEGGGAEVKNIKIASPAARAGLTMKATSCDGLSLCNWVLTEVNSRPLNLFFKDGEVKDRLNSVGMEVSIMVQPFDLVKQLKKQLKSIRGYKDYLLQ